MNILELYSGVGGMHMALNESKINGKIIAAVEISTVANSVYSHNFPNTLLLNRNIQNLTAKYINKLDINAIFMSPPCQPFTRNGLKKDELDSRTCSFSHILHILPELNVDYLLIENVKGFEISTMRSNLITALENNHFIYQEFILSPTQMGVSNTRHRYYCLAKKSPLTFSFEVGPLKNNLPENFNDSDLFPISDIIEEIDDIEKYLIPSKILLKHAMLLDICSPGCKRTCCFTKSYGKYVEGTGSVYTPKTKEEVDVVYKILQTLASNSNEEQYINCIRQLKLRFFTSREVARLMSFPESFTFPNELTLHQKYKLLGNSINIKVVSELIKVLVKSK